MGSQMDMEFTLILIEPSMQASGIMINNTEGAWKLGQMALCSKVSIKMVRNMGQVNLIGQTNLNTKVNFRTITSTVRGFTNGKMDANTRAHGAIRKCMAKEFLLLLMDVSTKERTWMTRNKGLESFLGRMERYIQVNHSLVYNYIIIVSIISLF
eukprot:403346895